MDGSDASLVARAKGGDEEAFRELVERHARNVFRLSYRVTRNKEDAEDVVQETFLKAHRALSRFDERAEFGSWIHAIAANGSLDVLRRRERRERGALSEPDAAEELPSGGPSPERSAHGSELGRRLQGAMRRLSAHERTAFVLRHFEGRSIAEIAGALGIRTGATKTTICRAVAKLRNELGALVSPP
jgi:RNA polymerase sigma-70 factor, ECF subfamily